MDRGDRFLDGSEVISFNRQLAIWSPGFFFANDQEIRIDYWREHAYWFVPERIRRKTEANYRRALRSGGDPPPIPAWAGRVEFFYHGNDVHDRVVQRRIRILAMRHPIIGELRTIEFVHYDTTEFHTVAGQVFVVVDDGYENPIHCAEAPHIADWTVAVTFISTDPGTVTSWSPCTPAPAFALSPKERGE